MALKPALHGRDHCPGGSDPIPCMGTVEWFRTTASNASLGTGYTALEFSGTAGDYDSGIPTFNLSSGDLVIGTHGLYSFHMQYGGATINPAVVTVLFSQLARTAGAIGTWSGSPPGFSGNAISQELVRFDNGTDDLQPYNMPLLFTYVAWDSSDTMPVTLQASAYVEEDEVGVATSSYDFSLFVVRHGSVFGS